MKTLFALLTCLGLVLGGCASDPNQAEKSKPASERLKVGMTKEEVRKMFGNPQSEFNDNTGTSTWIYTDTAKAFIPFYAIAGGKFQNITVVFDTDGKVKSWATGNNSIY